MWLNFGVSCHYRANLVVSRHQHTPGSLPMVTRPYYSVLVVRKTLFDWPTI